MTDAAAFGRYSIPTLGERRRHEVRGIAYCPICDKAEESTDYGRDEKNAIVISIGKIRLHMHLVHGINAA